MPGDFSKTSIADVPTFEIDASTFTIVLSIFCSINGFFETTVTPLISFVVGINSIVFSFIELLASEISKASEKPFVWPTAVTETMYLPSATFSKTKFPSLFATLILATEESFERNNVMVADSIVFTFPSITWPDTLPVLVCAWLNMVMVKAAVSNIRNFLIFIKVL